MVLTEWDDIGGVIGAVFVGIVALFVLVVYLEQRLAPPAPASGATGADAEHDVAIEPDCGRGLGHRDLALVATVVTDSRLTQDRPPDHGPSSGLASRNGQRSPTMW